MPYGVSQVELGTSQNGGPFSIYTYEAMWFKQNQRKTLIFLYSAGDW